MAHTVSKIMRCKMGGIKKIKESEFSSCVYAFCPECDRIITIETLERAKKDGVLCFECGAVYKIEDDKS